MREEEVVFLSWSQSRQLHLAVGIAQPHTPRHLPCRLHLLRKQRGGTHQRTEVEHQKEHREPEDIVGAEESKASLRRRRILHLDQQRGQKEAEQRHVDPLRDCGGRRLAVRPRMHENHQVQDASQQCGEQAQEGELLRDEQQKAGERQLLEQLEYLRWRVSTQAGPLG